MRSIKRLKLVSAVAKSSGVSRPSSSMRPTAKKFQALKKSSQRGPNVLGLAVSTAVSQSSSIAIPGSRLLDVSSFLFIILSIQFVVSIRYPGKKYLPNDCHAQFTGYQIDFLSSVQDKKRLESDTILSQTLQSSKIRGWHGLFFCMISSGDETGTFSERRN
jgi:hypothetical protein